MESEINYEDAMRGMIDDIGNMLNKVENNKACLQKIGRVIKLEVETKAPISDKEFYYTSGCKYPNTHIKDDVIYKVKKSSTGENYVSVSGGQKTWPKWHLVNDGHVATNGDWVEGTHFVDKIALGVEDLIDDIVVDFVKGCLE